MDRTVQKAGVMTTPTTLAAQIAQITANIPEPIDARIRAGAAAVRATGLPIGATAPAFTLPDATGEPVALAALLARGPVVLAFYRGEWCPFCNLELRALQQHLDEITAAGATVVAISPQAPDHSLSVTAEHELSFDVLSDVDQNVIDAYGLLYTVEGDTRDLMEHVFSRDLALENADGSWRLPIPATFVLDGDGIVRAAHVDADYRTRMEPADIVAAVAALR